MHNAMALLAITGFTITTFLPIDSSPGSRERIPDLARPSGRRDGSGELERTARRGARRLLLAVLVPLVTAFEGPPAVRLLLLVAVIHRGPSARERVADLVCAGIRCDAACQVERAADYA